jgi:vanillate O-demethylase monooxygenase subunit
VRSIPVVERHGAIWVWVGDADKADPQRIPDFFYHDHPDWVDMGHGFIPIKAHCQLVVDNLLDLSHIAFVHRRTVGNAESAEAETTTKIEGDTVTVERWLWNQPPVPLWRAAFGDYAENVDHWLNIHWQPPGYIFMDVGVTPVGRPKEEGIYSLTSHILVPADDRSTYYFWCSSRKPNWGNRLIDENWTTAVNFTFHEDQEIIEVQQKLLDRLAIDDSVDGYSFPLNVKSDTGPLHARRIMQRLLNTEDEEALQRSAG